MTATRNSARFGIGENAPRAAKVAALSLGIALFASGCGGGGTTGSEGEGGDTETTAAAATSALACPESEGGTGEEQGEKGDPAAVPASTTTSPTPLKLGSILPTTGTLAFLGPPEIAGVNLAVNEVNEAGGVLGQDISITHRDSGDTTTDIATQSVTDLLSQDVSAIIGAASSGVSKTVINQITGAGVIQFSPANTSPEFTDWDDQGLYFRTAPSDVLQGRTLGNYIMTCGAQTVGMITLNDSYGTGLQTNIQETVESAGGEVVANEMFNTGDSQFSSQVDAIAAAKPDAIVLISFDEAKSIIPLLVAKGVEASSIFMVDGNTTDYSKDLDPGTLEGAQGTIPGPFTGTGFQEALATVDPALTSLAYAGESYDAVNLISLAAEAAGSVEGAEIAKQLESVSKDGTKCFDFAGCVTLLRGGEDIDYDGISGPVSFDAKGDPTEAAIGIYKYDADNVPQPSRSEVGQL
ncbi:MULTISPECIES: ABC transporter substrate-binding protein [unclassified Arthrobacter]|jgi:branched-chain amino acid transport system substrate-binding protein|uniref:ABC transporter substrate-binding protein n=1 Tax=unclassified Arthrobacter TaxID=235627 RepID=UPI0006FA04A2|nr:ABC transporter substrate-binding protein [Arthrobacter sp. Leaf234]KQO01801.1 amino acid ABC transporter substrate-binding protein [Arthrobacter sp. Leaf234]